MIISQYRTIQSFLLRHHSSSNEDKNFLNFSYFHSGAILKRWSQAEWEWEWVVNDETTLRSWDTCIKNFCFYLKFLDGPCWKNQIQKLGRPGFLAWSCPPWECTGEIWVGIKLKKKASYSLGMSLTCF